MASNMPTPRSREFGSILRNAAQAKGMSTRQLGTLIRRNGSHVSRYFQGLLIPSEAETGAICVHLGIDGEALEALLQIRLEAADPNWVTGVNRQLAVLSEYEAAASLIFTAQAQRIPGLLQVRSYAETLIRATGAAEADVQAGADFRMSRRAKVFASKVEATFIIGEYALRYPECGGSAWGEQLRDMAEVARLPQITIRILPITALYTPLRDGGFVLIEGAEPGTGVVYLEQFASSSTLTADQYIRGYKEAAEWLRRDAMSPDDSVRLIEEVENRR
ncbi:helix-turn-helix transcriptional regulator [Amycolatopsis rhabdoformis]|uniref:Helix-turn-helix transcriptional regulator n=1 Tax=Amycolatopsis rhabdoformis TaxID=1448059 RepID=A0ABZ1IBP7_9PSEU|nr:helix-turn-helix transcriptional regulator [Amycolatopsis rhabdoformis]WSE31058.1 helix-turn-helix transcriptional regulator [Amycolatopsis rhabdoformis]